MNFIDYAQELLDEGFNPLPLKLNKAPMLPVGHPFLYNPIDKIESRFFNCEKIGIACGVVSDGFYAIDFDCHQGQDIESVFMDFYENPTIQNLIHQDKLVVYKTPAGGFHCYLRINEKIQGSVLCKYADGKTMIELRGNGQYVATYPSEGYDYIAGNEIVKIQKIDQSEYDWIIDLVKSFNKVENHQEIVNSSKREWPTKWDDGKLDGKFNNESAQLVKDLLSEIGWKLINIRRHDGVELWQRPGKGIDQGVSATFGAKFNMFYCFTSNAYPFKETTAYNPFQIYTIIKFDGDWKKAKDSLKPPAINEPEITQDHSFFPIDVFPKPLQDYILELNRTLNFHPDFLAASAMFSVATINGNRYKLRVKQGWEAQTIFWFACVGYPGTIKTHPVKTLINPISHIDRVSKVLYDSEMVGYDPDAKPKQPKPKFRQILISDYTLEALHHIHDINTRGIGLYKDELVGFLKDMNKYRKSGSDEQFWLESFNNGSHIVNRVTKEPILLNNICINLIGTIQHDVLNKTITEYEGNGLIDRFLYTSAESTVYNLTSSETDPKYGEMWSMILNKMHKHFFYAKPEDTEIVKMTPEAFKIYQEIDAKYVLIQNAEEENQKIKNYLSKMKTYVPRFALLLAIMDSIFDDSYIMVDVKQMQDAGRIADYFIKTATSLFLANEVKKDISEVSDNMRGKTRNEKVIALYQKSFKPSEIYGYFGFSKQNFYKIIKSVDKSKP